MNKSEQINEIAQALCNFQTEDIDPVKNKVAHNCKYADLPQILVKTRPILQKHGLSVSQIADAAHEKVVVETVLMHTSGQWISGRLEMDCLEGGRGMSKPQAAGAVVTYARRYGYCSILGIAADDDTDAQQTDNQQKGSNNNYNQKRELASQKVSVEQIKDIYARCNNNEDIINRMKTWAGVKEIKDLSVEKYNEALPLIENERKAAMGGNA